MNLSENNQSLIYLQNAEELIDSFNDDYDLLSRLFAGYGKNYYVLGFVEKSNQSYDKAIMFALKKNDNKNDKLLHFIYGNKAMNFKLTHNHDSLYYYIHKAYKTLPKVIEATNLADYFMTINKNEDSVKFYIDKAEFLLKTSASEFDKLFFYYTSGKFYTINKEYDKALECYNKSLEIAVKIRRPKNIVNNYKKISEVYQLQSNVPKANEYLLKYTKLKDSIADADVLAMQASEKKIIDDERQISKKSKQKLFYILSAALMLCVVIGSFNFLYYRKVRKKDSLLKENEVIINQKDKQVKELKLKVNESFEEIITLAKENRPEFLSRFQEVYPDFAKKLLQINSDLNPSELKFCALLFFNFSIKDMAKYTYTSPKTIQNRKTLIRKRLNIPLESNISIWIRNLILQ